MLRSMNELENYTIGATDGNIGHVRDFFFDDHLWVVRYLVVETGSWLSSRKVLISPISIHDPSWADKLLPVSITRAQVKDSPDIDTHKPVSRQHEAEFLGYYGYPYYWGGAGLWGGGMYPYALFPGYSGYGDDHVGLREPEHARERTESARHKNDDPYLRSCKEVIGYHIHASDGDIGHVSGLIVDEETWSVRYLVIDTSNWWIDHRVLVSLDWVKSVQWLDRSVTVAMSREAIKAAPAYDPSALFSREREIDLYRHYGRTGYWSDEAENVPVIEGV
jgi:uncharacterized protein YrrD